MKKKILTLLLALVVSASALAGCGNSAEPAANGNAAEDTAEECVHEWVDATCEEPKHCSKCGETEGEALGHTLTEATYHEAATCTVCGKTEGEPKQSYFEERGTEVADAPVACTVNVLIYDPNNPTEHQMTTDATWEQIDCYSEPADEEGYQLVHLDVCASSQLYYDAALDIDYTSIFISGGIYDWYTGRHFPDRYKANGATFDYSITLEVDGISYDVAYSNDSRWEFDDWVYNDSGDAICNIILYATYTFKVPDGYDGLVFAAVPENEYRVPDTETIDESESYAFDEDEYTEGTKFFRINKEGMVPERLPEDSAN